MHLILVCRLSILEESEINNTSSSKEIEHEKNPRAKLRQYPISRSPRNAGKIPAAPLAWRDRGGCTDQAPTLDHLAGMPRRGHPAPAIYGVGPASLPIVPLIGASRAALPMHVAYFWLYRKTPEIGEKGVVFNAYLTLIID